MRLIELPRNLDSKALSFQLPPPEIEVFADDELAHLYAVVKGQSRLHFLLMLGAGFTAKDISDLHPAEVDWTEGTISRRRSKTRRHADAPTVTYKLWPQTFALLREHRSVSPDAVLLSPNGERWVADKPHDGVYARSDKVAAALRYWMKKAKVQHAPKASGRRRRASWPNTRRSSSIRTIFWRIRPVKWARSTISSRIGRSFLRPWRGWRGRWACGLEDKTGGCDGRLACCIPERPGSPCLKNSSESPPGAGTVRG